MLFNFNLLTDKRFSSLNNVKRNFGLTSTLVQHHNQFQLQKYMDKLFLKEVTNLVDIALNFSY